MKKTFFLVAVLLMTVMAQAQNLNSFFKKYADDERFSYTKVGDNMQTLTLEINDNNAKALADKIEKEVLQIIKSEGFTAIVQSRDKGERSYIYSKKAKDEKNNEMVIINSESGEMNVLWMIGKGMMKGVMNMTTDLIQGNLDGIDSIDN